MYLLTLNPWSSKTTWLYKGLKRFLPTSILFFFKDVGRKFDKPILCVDSSLFFSNSLFEFKSKVINIEAVKTKFLPNKLNQKELVNTLNIVKTPEIKDLSFNGSVLKKPLVGSRGKDIKLLFKPEPFESGFFLEEYIEACKNIRILVINSKIVAIYERVGTDIILSGSNSESIKILKESDQPELINITKKIINEFGIEYAGFDFIQSKKTKEWYFLEANLSPIFNTYMKWTSHNPFKYF